MHAVNNVRARQDGAAFLGYRRSLPRCVTQRVDRPLIDACQRGDDTAFSELFELCQWRVHAVTRHYCADEAVARDVAQEVFLAVFQAIGQFRHEAQFETWLHRIVVNACLKEQRRRRTLLPLVENADILLRAPGGSREEGMLRREVASEVRAAVATLRPKLRLPLLMKHLRGLSYDEIGAALNCSPGTVASRLNRARSALATKLAHLRYAGPRG